MAHKVVTGVLIPVVVVALGLAVYASLRKQHVPRAPSVAPLRAEIAQLKTEVATMQRTLVADAKARPSTDPAVRKIETCLPELWAYIDSANVDVQSTGTAYVTYPQQIASTCNKLLTGYSGG